MSRKFICNTNTTFWDNLKNKSLFTGKVGVEFETNDPRIIELAEKQGMIEVKPELSESEKEADRNAAIAKDERIEMLEAENAKLKADNETKSEVKPTRPRKKG